MKEVVKKVLNKSIGAFGDKMNEIICIAILYQPKSYKRGECEKMENTKEICEDK